MKIKSAETDHRPTSAASQLMRPVRRFGIVDAVAGTEATVVPVWFVRSAVSE